MIDPVSDAAYWEERYREGTARWDLGGPTPVLSALLDGSWAPAPGAVVAFPGSGGGHDVRHWRDNGYDAIGFDFAIQPDGIPVEALDVFELGDRYPARFDAVVEYTCFCAIDPTRRAEYASSLSRSIRPGGLLIALLFPVGEKEGGPPYAVQEPEIEGVIGLGLELIHLENPALSVGGREDRERLAVFRKPDLD